MRYIPLILLLCLAGCTVETVEQTAWRTCHHIEPWQAFGDCMRAVYGRDATRQRHDAERREREEDMIGAALLNGSFMPRPRTTCTAIGAVIICN